MNLPQRISSTPWLAVVFIGLFVISAYSPILNSSFKVVYDSDTIVGNPQIRDWGHMGKVFTESLFKSNIAYRPLTLTTHALEYQFFSFTPFFYYSFNILIHLMSALLVYALMILLVRSKPVAFLVSVLFAIHPGNWEAVSFLSGRPELLNGFFNLSALLCCVLYMRRLNGWWMALSLICFICALLARESREFFLGVFFLYFLFQASGEEVKGIRWLIVLPYMMVVFLYMALRNSLGGIAWPVSDLSDAMMRLLSVFRAVLLEVNHLLMPGDVHVHGILSGASNDALMFLAAGLVVLLFALFLIKRKGIDPAVMFLIGWFLVGLWPLMHAAFLAGPGGTRLPANETFIYLTTIPLITLVVLLFRWLFEISKENSKFAGLIVTLAGVGFITLFYVLTYKNAAQAYDEVAILKASGADEPPNAATQYSLGLLYVQKGNPAQAQYHFNQALELDPNLTEARLGLAKTLSEQGKLLEAIKMYESISTPGKHAEIIGRDLKAIYSILTLNQEAIVAKNPQDLNAHFTLGIYYSKVGEVGKAINAYQQVIEQDPDNEAGLRPLALRFQGMLYAEIGRQDKAQENFDLAR